MVKRQEKGILSQQEGKTLKRPPKDEVALEGVVTTKNRHRQQYGGYQGKGDVGVEKGNKGPTTW